MMHAARLEGLLLWMRLAVLAALAGAAPAARAVDLVYTDHSLVDFYVLNPEDVSNPAVLRKVTVYRDGAPIHTAEGTNLCDVGYSDRGLARDRRYAYSSVLYVKNGSGDWVEEQTTPARTGNTAYCRGRLYNAPDNPFGRPPVGWSGAVEVGGPVWVETGVLRILPGATVDMNRRYAWLGTRGSGKVEAVGAAFNNLNGWHETGLIKLEHRAAFQTCLSNCVLNGVRVVLGSGSAGIGVAGNTFTSAWEIMDSEPMLIVDGSDSRVSGNSLPTNSIYVYGSNHVVAGNACYGWMVQASNTCLEANRSPGWMWVYGDGHRILSNTAASVLVRGHRNVLAGNRIGPAPTGIDLQGCHNVVASNTLAGDFFSYLLFLRVGGSISNTLVGNRLLGRCNCAIYTASDSADNLIYDNYIGSEAFHLTEAGGLRNRWAIEKTAGPNIVGGPYRGGNCWAAHAGTDADGDGLFDAPLDLPGTAGASDPRPLVGPGELVLSAAVNNPGGAVISPEGRPFAVARLKLRAVSPMPGPARVTGMTFTFVGHPARIPVLAGAGLLAGDRPDETAMRVLATAAFRSNRVAFAFSDAVPAGGERFYSVAYQFRYEDEYTDAGPFWPPGAEVGEIRFGAAVDSEAIVSSARVFGGPVAGSIRPIPSRYLTARTAPARSPLGMAIENTAEILAVWSLYGEICAAQNPAVLETLTSSTGTTILWIKDGRKAHLLSAFANRPVYRLHACAGGATEGASLPVSEVLDAYLENGRPRWARGLAYADPYQYEDLLFDGEIYLHASARLGNYKGFKRDVLAPLRAAYGADRVILSHFRAGAHGGYYGLVRVDTRQATQRALAVLPGRPRVLDQAGRRLMVAYESSVGLNPAPDERIHECADPGSPVPPADYDGDGITDPVSYDSASGRWQLWLSGRDYAPVVFEGGGPDSEPVPADYDGDGITDPGVYTAASGRWRVWLSSQSHRERTAVGWGGPGASPHPADYDGDGKADPAVYVEQEGAWRAWLSGNGYSPAAAVGWGGPGFIAVPADYDGDGKADPAVYAQQNGAWRAWLSAQGYREAAVRGWGLPGIEAAPADYDGDGKMDPAVFDPQTGRRRVWLSRYGYAPLDL